MTRIDWVVLKRLTGSIALALVVLIGLIALVESLNTSRFRALSDLGGPLIAVAAIIVAASRWAIATLSVILLIGAIIGLLDLQATREMTVIKASGISVWRMMRAPLIAVLVFGTLVTLVVDTVTVQWNRALWPGPQNRDAFSGRSLWIEQRGAEVPYLLEARRASPTGTTLEQASIFMLGVPRERILAPVVTLGSGEWVMPTATRYRSNAVPETLTDFRLSTTNTVGDMRAKLSSINDLTVFELASTLAARVNDPALRSATLTRLLRLLGLPLSLAGSLLIAFAFTAGYRRTNKYGVAVLYGIVLGFMVYVVTEMAGRAGDAGAIDPIFAATGPAIVAIVIGTTVLLNREDGRT